MTMQGNPVQRIRLRVRVRWLNTRRGIRIAAATYIARSALIQTACDGRFFGGRIVIAGGVIISDGVIVTTYGGSIEIGADTSSGVLCALWTWRPHHRPQKHDRGAHGDHPGQSRL